MDNNVGRILINKSLPKVLVFLISVSCSAHDITLRVVDQNNRPIKEVMAGYPCKIEVTVHDTSESPPSFKIPGIESFHLLGREMQMRSINGVSSIIHRYSMRADKPGVFALGPVEMDSDGQTLISNKLMLRVVDNQLPTSQVQSGAHDSEIDVFARLTINKSRAVVGEKIGATLRVYVRGGDINVHALVKPDVADCRMAAFKEAISGQEIIKNKQYEFLEWTWDLFPSAAGTLTIPAYMVEYDAPKQYSARRSQGLFGALFNSFERKRIYSNAVKIAVDALPSTTELVQGIGEFKSFIAHIKPGSIKQGEGAVLTLELEGDAYMDELEVVELVGMPPVLKWYTSKVYTQESKEEGVLPKRCFEYIVQGMQAGEWQIPPQSFRYFDTRKRVYKKLETFSLPLTVTAQATQALSAQDYDQSDVSESAAAENDASPLAPLDTRGPWYPVRDRMIPWWFFMMLLLMPVVWFGRKYIRALFMRIYVFFVPEYQRNRAYARARAALRDAQKEHRFTSIYLLFIELFADRAALSATQVTHEMIEKMLRDNELSEIELAAWHNYFTRISEASFVTTRSSALSAQLFEEGFAWLALFEKKV